MTDMTVESLALKLATNDISKEAPGFREERKYEQKKVIAGVELDEKTIHEIKEAFLEFDIDSDGTITTQVLSPRNGNRIFKHYNVRSLAP